MFWAGFELFFGAAFGLFTLMMMYVVAKDIWRVVLWLLRLFVKVCAGITHVVNYPLDKLGPKLW